MAAQQPDCVVCEHAVPAAAVCDDLAVRWQLRKPLSEFLEGDVEGSGQVASGVLGLGSHVEDDGVVTL